MSFGNPSDDEIREILTQADDGRRRRLLTRTRPGTATKSRARCKRWDTGSFR